MKATLTLLLCACSGPAAAPDGANPLFDAGADTRIAPDAAPSPPDAAPSPPDAAPSPPDAAPSPPDAAPSPLDAAPAPLDLAPSPLDLAPSPLDTSLYPMDAALPVDAGSPDLSLPAWALVFSDEFNGANGTGLDPAKWAYETGGNGWGNGELEYYTNRTDNAVIQNGHLVITARQESYQGRQYTSARVKTAGRFAFKYGRVEMRAILPQGRGIWPAFWMLGANIDTGVAWPDCGEVDIMEFVGQTPQKIYGTIHGPAYNGAGGIGSWHPDPAGFSGGYHVYAVEWEPNVIRWYYDTQVYEVRTPADLDGRIWVFDHDFFILLNLAVGGQWPGPPDNTTVFPQTYSVDYVRVYQRPGGMYPVLPARNIVSLKARLNGKFVSADNYNAELLSANRGAASTWELFELKDLGNGQSALWALSDDKYVSGGAGGGNPLAATAETVGPAETFRIAANPDGSKSLQSMANGKYVTLPGGGNSPLQATAAAIGTAEEFDLLPH